MHTMSNLATFIDARSSHLMKKQQSDNNIKMKEELEMETGAGEVVLGAGMIQKTKSNDDDDIGDEELDDEEEEEEESGSAMGYDETLDCCNHVDDDEEKVLVPIGELTAIKSNLQLLNHQVSLLIKAFNVKPCGCETCEIAQKIQTTQSTCQSSNHKDGSDQHISNGSNAATEENTKVGNYSLDYGESTQRGRRSKYCTPAEKKAVAVHVAVHGATAAARRFNIPPAVAAYYHRREFKKKPAIGKSLGPATPAHLQHAFKGNDSSGEGERSMDVQRDEANKGSNQQLAQLWQSNSGSHAYLRGRGRGRPKLIGDELDYELVEHIVKLKQQTPNAHLTASQALMIARNYIIQKAPGLLEENGGQVKLKITWAMKLVTRVQEREREIQLGLPPGSLQNLPRSLVQAGENNTFVDELLGQNILNQQINDSVNALLAAAGNPTDDSGGATTSNTDNAMLNLLGISGNAADIFGTGDQQPGTSQKALNNEPNTEEQDMAIRQLLASLQGGKNEQEAAELDVAAALAQMSG